MNTQTVYRYDADWGPQHITLLPWWRVGDWFLRIEGPLWNYLDDDMPHREDVIMWMLREQFGIALKWLRWSPTEHVPLYLAPGKTFARPGKTPTVYFVKDLATGLIKIGHSNDVRKRLRAIFREGNPYELLGIIEGNKDWYFHSLFDEVRAKGEWFVDCPELRRFIREYASLSNHMQDNA